MPLPDPRLSRAVLIGTSEYESLDPLEAVVANVEHLRSLFEAEDLWGLPAENCTVLLNREQPGEVLAAVREAAEAARDTLVVYFAGHGLRSPDNDELYLALRTTVKDRMFTALRYDDLRRELLHTAVNVASKVVLLDCCYSGVAMRDAMSATDEVAERARIDGTYLMTASASTVLALAPQGEKHTAFTGEIIDAISTGVPDGPDLLNMEKLFWHVHGRLQAKGLPIPQQRAGNSGGMISLVRNRRGAAVELDAIPQPRRLPDIPVGFEFALSSPPQELVQALDELGLEGRVADTTGLLTAIAGRVDVQEVAALLDYLPHAGKSDYTSVLLDAVLRGAPERLVELVATLRLLGQDALGNTLLQRAASLTAGHVSQLADLARLLRTEHPDESRRLIATAIRDEAAAAGPDRLIVLVGALWSAGLGDEIERMLRESEVDLGDVDALALARALDSSGRGELAVTLYLRSLDAVAALTDDEIVKIVRTARECDRHEDAGKLVEAALRHRDDGPRYTGFAMALWSAGLNQDADSVLDAAASRLANEGLKSVATSLRLNSRADAAFELYRKAAAGRSAETVVEFAESLRASGRPMDGLRLLTEAATRAPADLVAVLVELRRRDRSADVARFSALVLRRSPQELAEVIVGLQTHGVHDVALQYRESIMRSGSAEGVVRLIEASTRGGFYAIAEACAERLVTERDDGSAAFAAWLCDAPTAVAESFLPAMAELDLPRVLAIARSLYGAFHPELSSGLLGLVQFDGVEGVFAAFEAANWPEGLEAFYASKAQKSLDAVYAEYLELEGSKQDRAARFLVEQSAMFRPAEQVPDLLKKFLGSGPESICIAVGFHRPPADIAVILNVLNLKHGRLKKCAQEILFAAAERERAEVDAIAEALRAKLLEHYARDLLQAHLRRS